MSNVNDLILAGQFDVAIKEIKKVKKPNHWHLCQLSSAYYEKGDYKRAIEAAEAAAITDPDCPLVLWHLGTATAQTNPHGAIVHFAKISMGRTSCNEGGYWLANIQADACFWLTGLFLRLGNVVSARYNCNMYKKALKSRFGSYNKDQLLRLEKQIKQEEDKSVKPRASRAKVRRKGGKS